MDGRPVCTGGLPVVRSALGLMTYPPQVVSVRQARRFVEGVVAGTALHPLADDAGLLVSELAANAVLHARTDFDVVVYEIQDGVRVSVRDRSASLPVLVAPSATAMSGRGLALVQTLAAQWGARSGSEKGKSVWFELVLAGEPAEADAGGAGGAGGVVDEDEEPSASEELSVEDLLAAWSDAEEVMQDPPSPPGPPSPSPSAGSPQASTAGGAGNSRATGATGAGGGVEVVLPALDAAALLAAKEQMDDVLRELQLVLLDQREETTSTHRDVAIARRLDESARGFDDVRRQVRQQVSRAVASRQEQVALRLHLLPGAAARAAAYWSAVEEAEALVLDGGLLTVVDTLQRHRAVRRAYLDEVIATASE